MPVSYDRILVPDTQKSVSVVPESEFLASQGRFESTSCPSQGISANKQDRSPDFEHEECCATFETKADQYWNTEMNQTEVRRFESASVDVREGAFSMKVFDHPKLVDANRNVEIVCRQVVEPSPFHWEKRSSPCLESDAGECTFDAAIPTQNLFFGGKVPKSTLCESVQLDV